VFPTVASRWNDAGVDRLYAALRARVFDEPVSAEPGAAEASNPQALIPPSRGRYLAEIAETLRGWHQETQAEVERARDAWALQRSAAALVEAEPASSAALAQRGREAFQALDAELRGQLEEWPELRQRYTTAEQEYQVRGRAIRVTNHTETLSGTQLPKVALPRGEEWGELVRYLRSENLPGRFPFTAGVFPFDREAEDPTRMFAGEGPPERTNRRFHLIASGQPAARLSTAFDSVTLYGRDPDERPDIYGKVGNSGVSICT
ncbi:unnamed protein product, partial [marine sediment metagenome]